MVDPIFQSDTFVLAQKLLDVSVMRQEAVAANIANAETPGYRRVDVASDFATELKARLASGDLAASVDSIKPHIAEDLQARTVRPDGNSVELQHELLAMNKNAVEHQFLTEVVSFNIKQLKIPVSGHSG